MLICTLSEFVKDLELLLVGKKLLSNFQYFSLTKLYFYQSWPKDLATPLYIYKLLIDVSRDVSGNSNIIDTTKIMCMNFILFSI